MAAPDLIDGSYEMDLRQLRNLLAVMEEGSIGKAAERLHVSQPALTKSIQRLEEELGVRLFERKARGMDATFYAEHLRSYAESACIGMAEVLKELNALKNGTEGLLTVAATPLVAHNLLTDVAVRLTLERPNLQIRIVSQNHELFTELQAGKFNLVVAMLYSEIPTVEFSKEYLFDDRLVLVMRPGHPVSKLRKLSIKGLLNYKWALADAETWHYKRLAVYFQEEGFDPPRANISSRDPMVLKSVIMNSDHIGVIARLGVEKELKEGLLTAVDLPSPLMRRPIGIVRRMSDVHYPAVGAFERVLKDVCRERGYDRTGSTA